MNVRFRLAGQCLEVADAVDKVGSDTLHQIAPPNRGLSIYLRAEDPATGWVRPECPEDSSPSGLSILTDIPHASKLEIAENRKSDPLSSEVDIVVYGEFLDAAALAAYKAHELYAEAIRRVRPLRELRIAADYDSSTAITELETSGKPTAGDLPVGQ